MKKNDLSFRNNIQKKDFAPLDKADIKRILASSMIAVAVICGMLLTLTPALSTELPEMNFPQSTIETAELILTVAVAVSSLLGVILFIFAHIETARKNKKQK